MMHDRRTRCVAGTVLTIAATALLACHGSVPGGPSTEPAYQAGAKGNFLTIQAAINAAPPGEIVLVLAGTYSEHVTLNKPLKLRSNGAVLDGAGAGGGTGIGILVSNATNVEISGFTVQNFERGIVLQNVSGSLLKGNEVRNNTAKSGPPFTVGVTPWEGIVLIASRNNEVSDNFSHDNGHDGLLVTEGSAANKIHDNRLADNGAQTPTSFG